MAVPRWDGRGPEMPLRTLVGLRVLGSAVGPGQRPGGGEQTRHTKAGSGRVQPPRGECCLCEPRSSTSEAGRNRECPVWTQKQNPWGFVVVCLFLGSGLVSRNLDPGYRACGLSDEDVLLPESLRAHLEVRRRGGCCSHGTFPHVPPPLLKFVCHRSPRIHAQGTGGKR